MKEKSESVCKCKIEGAIFDLDGTLLDSMPVWDTLGYDYLRSKGVTPNPDLQQRLQTMSLEQAAQDFKNDYGITDSIQEILDAINGMIERFYVETVKLKPGVAEFLEKLSKYDVKMCVATASDRYLTEAALKKNNIDHFFSKIFTCSEIGSGKDSADVYIAALEHLKTSKKKTVVFEDAYHAVLTAKKAGFTVAAVFDRAEQKNVDLIKAKADFYFESFYDLSRYFD